MTLEARGRKTCRSVALSIFLMSIATIDMYVSVNGTDKLPTQIVRLALTGWMCWHIAAGSNLARRIGIVLTLAAGTMAVHAIVDGGPIQSWLVLLYPTLYLTCGSMLLFSKSVKAYVAAQR